MIYCYNDTFIEEVTPATSKQTARGPFRWKSDIGDIMQLVHTMHVELRCYDVTQFKAKTTRSTDTRKKGRKTDSSSDSLVFKSSDFSAHVGDFKQTSLSLSLSLRNSTFNMHQPSETYKTDHKTPPPVRLRLHWAQIRGNADNHLVITEHSCSSSRYEASCLFSVFAEAAAEARPPEAQRAAVTFTSNPQKNSCGSFVRVQCELAERPPGGRPPTSRKKNQPIKAFREGSERRVGPSWWWRWISHWYIFTFLQLSKQFFSKTHRVSRRGPQKKLLTSELLRRLRRETPQIWSELKSPCSITGHEPRAPNTPFKCCLFWRSLT